MRNISEFLSMDKREKMLLAEKIFYIANKYSQYISEIKDQLDRQLSQMADNSRLRIAKLRAFKNIHLKDARRVLETVKTHYSINEIRGKSAEERDILFYIGEMERVLESLEKEIDAELDLEGGEHGVQD